MTTTFRNSIIFTGKDFIHNQALVVEDDYIKGFIKKEDISKNTEIVDCENCIIAPGFVDLQIYGGGGFLFSNDPSAVALNAMAKSIVASGTTGFLITLATNSFEVFQKAIRVVKENPHPAVMGLHLEGPYINPEKAGAHLQRWICKPEINELKKLLKEADGVIKMMTLAPEFCDREIIQLLNDNGVLVSAGHSNATFEEAVTGFENGISATTHLFNAMSPFHHRDTGLPGATCSSDNVYASIIADGIHVDYNTIAISKKLLGQRLFLITDAVEENKVGDYIHIKKEDRFTLPDGTLSGSRLTLLKAVKNCVEKVGIQLEEAMKMASTYPAHLIGDTHRGKLEVGMKANCVIFSTNFELKYTILEGQIVPFAI
ncbi:MAG: N-acetylglucosamine-6-phosphate deacetylase [Ginsengibacter sp.]|jgi:N-acetylglucosamine-6-phosphate deacetylase